MKKRFTYIIIAAVLAATILGAYSAVTAQRAENLYGFAAAAKSVNIHIGEFTVGENARGISRDALVEAFRLRLEKRRSIDFTVCDDMADADLSVNADFVNFIYQDKDPVDVIFPPFALASDILIEKNYARLEYRIEVFSTKKEKVVWKRLLKATLSEKNMPEDEAIPMIADRAAYLFIKECFGRPKK